MTSIDPKYHILHGLLFKVIAEFTETIDGILAANDYMEANPGVGVLAVVDGRVILANNDDPGVATDTDLETEWMDVVAKIDRMEMHGQLSANTLH